MKQHSFQVLGLTTFDAWGNVFFLIFCSSSFWNLNDFIIDLFSKALGLFTLSWLQLTFPRNSADSVFLFWLYSPEIKRGIHGNVWVFNQFQRFLSNWKVRHYTDFSKFRMDTTKMFFLAKQDSFQDSCNKHLQYRRNTFFSHILARFLKLNNFESISFLVLVTFVSPRVAFSRNSADSAFSVWL